MQLGLYCPPPSGTHGQMPTTGFGPPHWSPGVRPGPDRVRVEQGDDCRLGRLSGATRASSTRSRECNQQASDRKSCAKETQADKRNPGPPHNGRLVHGKSAFTESHLSQNPIVGGGPHPTVMGTAVSQNDDQSFSRHAVPFGHRDGAAVGRGPATDRTWLRSRACEPPRRNRVAHGTESTPRSHHR
jgi:hypothetical protein